MTDSAMFLSPSEAASRLGVSTKALRLYEQRGLIAPARTEAGWRAYGPADMARAAGVSRLRSLGLSLAEVVEGLDGDEQCLASVLLRHQAKLGDQARQIADKIEKVRLLRVGKMARPLNRLSGGHVAIDLPWPWGGERFELNDVRPLNYITGPLGCGKTRLAEALAQSFPEAIFLGLDRLAAAATQKNAQADAHRALKARVGLATKALVEEGAAKSPALAILLWALEQRGSSVLVIDTVEHELDQATQTALIAHMRKQATSAPPIFLTTRSSTILNMAELGPEETVIHCPANHNPPTQVAPIPGAPGYEAVASCLATPEVRARTAGVVAHRPAHVM